MKNKNWNNVLSNCKGCQSAKVSTPKPPPLRQNSDLSVAEWVTFMPPLPTELAIQTNAIEPRIMQLINTEFQRFVACTNLDLEWGRELLRTVEENASKISSLSTNRRISTLTIKDQEAEQEDVRLVPGIHIEEIIEDPAYTEDEKPVETNSPKTLSISSSSLPIKKPRTRFLPTLQKEITRGLTTINLHLRELSGSFNISKFWNKKTFEVVRYAPRDYRTSALLPVQNNLKNQAEMAFRMDLEDYLGLTAYAWTKLVRERLARSNTVAKNVTDSVIRLTLPIVLTDLENLSVVDYIERYCQIAEKRLMIYETLYSRLRIAISSVGALRDVVLGLMASSVTVDQLNEFIKLLNRPEDHVLKLSTFFKCLGLCERLYDKVISSPEKDDEVISVEEAEKWQLQAGPLERLDFRNLSSRLKGVKLQPALKRLLERLEKQASSQDHEFPVKGQFSESVLNTLTRLFKRRKNSSCRSLTKRSGPTLRITRH